MRPDEIASALRRAVQERVIRPGRAINQDELARQYGVSRIPLREALRTLVGEGLIIMRPGLGAVVTELQVSEVQELYGLRLQLKPPLAGPVVDHVRRRDTEDLATLGRHHAGGLEQEQSEEWSGLNYRFHRRLYELSEAEARDPARGCQVLNLVEPYARVHAHVLGLRARGCRRSGSQWWTALRAGDVAAPGRHCCATASTAPAPSWSPRWGRGPDHPGLLPTDSARGARDGPHSQPCGIPSPFATQTLQFSALSEHQRSGTLWVHTISRSLVCGTNHLYTLYQPARRREGQRAVRSKSKSLSLVAVVAATTLVAAGCGSKGEKSADTGGKSGTLTIGASMSLTGSLAREGALTKEGYEVLPGRSTARAASGRRQEGQARHPVPGRHVQAGHRRAAGRPVQRQGRAS